MISSCRDFNSSSLAWCFSVSFPYIGTTSSRAWFIIFSSLILISFGSNFSCNFFEISCARVLVDSGVLSRCSFGRIRAWPLLRGLISRIAMFSAFSAILYEGVCFVIIEQKMHCPPRCVS